MKTLLLLILCFILSGCSQKTLLNLSSDTEPQVVIKESTDEPSTAATEIISDETIPSTDVPKTEPAETLPPETTTSLIQATIYYGNDNADGFKTKTILVTELNTDILIQNLIDVGVLSEGTEILSEKHADSCLHIDLNTAFRDKICSMGTAGEYIIMGSLVNTILDNYKDTTQSVYITVNGEILESGHNVYDFELTRYN